MSAYLSHLQKDKKLVNILQSPLPTLSKRKNVPLRLMASIMSQQLNTKVAAVIYKRFLQLFDEVEPTVGQVLEEPPEALRSIGLSQAKVGYVHNVAQFFLTHKINDRQLHKMSNEEVVGLLTQIKGVGTWTVEMLLMFTLAREDVFPMDDLAIQNAMIKIYKLDNTNKKAFREKMQKISAKWSPYRSYACLHLWQWKDNVPIG